LRKKAAELLFMDKKRVGGLVHFLLPKGIGEVKIEKIPVEELISFLREEGR